MPATWRRRRLQALANLETVLEASGFELADVVRLNTYVTDVDAYRQAGPRRWAPAWLRRAVGRRRPSSASRAWRSPSCSSSSRPRRSRKGLEPSDRRAAPVLGRRAVTNDYVDNIPAHKYLARS